MDQILLSVGDRAPSFRCPSSNNPEFQFDTVAGRYIVLCFLGTGAIESNRRLLRFVTGEIRRVFDDDNVSFFGVSVDPQDLDANRLQAQMPGARFFWDFDRAVSRRFGALPNDRSDADGNLVYRPFTLVLDPMLRVLERIGLTDVEAHNRRLRDVLEALPPLERYAGVELVAPVLVVPRVFEPEFCRRLIDVYRREGGHESGAMINKGDYTVGRIDHSFKRRQDCMIRDDDLRAAMRTRISRRLAPEIRRAFQYNPTRVERYLAACYDGASGGFFRAHRDNTTRATAHRRFACSINLNAEEYDGGDLRFPEFGTRTYRAPTGGAVVFSCSLLHEATAVTRGVRYAALPFLFDEAAERIRVENARYLSSEVIDKRTAPPRWGGELTLASYAAPPGRVPAPLTGLPTVRNIRRLRQKGRHRLGV